MSTSVRTTRVPLELLPIDESGFHLCVTVYINRKKCRLVLDTGASRTVFDREEIKQFVKEGSTELEGRLSVGLGTDNMETHAVRLDTFKIGRLTLRGFEALALDLNMLNTSYDALGHGKVVGVLGSDILNGHEAVIDFGKKKLRLRYSA